MQPNHSASSPAPPAAQSLPALEQLSAFVQQMNAFLPVMQQQIQTLSSDNRLFMQEGRRPATTSMRPETWSSTTPSSWCARTARIARRRPRSEALGRRETPLRAVLISSAHISTNKDGPSRSDGVAPRDRAPNDSRLELGVLKSAPPLPAITWRRVTLPRDSSPRPHERSVHSPSICHLSI